MADLEFNGTCEVFDLRTCPGMLLKKYLNPCSCLTYYGCTNNYEMRLETCSENTAWDYRKEICNHKNDVVFAQPCDEETNVWTRCNVTEQRTEQLRQICTNSGTTQSSMTSIVPEGQTDDVNPGIIIGSVAAGALIAVLVLIVIYVLYTRRNQDKINKGRNTTITHNPEYFEGGKEDDPYAVINETHVMPTAYMSNPAYNGTGGSGTLNQANGSCANAGVDGIDEDVEYDNSGAILVRSDYTTTLRRSTREYETPLNVRASGSGQQTSDTISDVNTNGSSDNGMSRADMSEGNINVDETGNKNSSDDGHDSVLSGVNEATSSALSDSEGVGGNTHEDAPDYYILEKSEL